jgi:signal transduction histidine kinase
VKSLVELHDGIVRVEGASAGSGSEGVAMRGARFVVELPAAPDDE